MKAPKTIQEYISQHPKWTEELEILCSIMAQTELDVSIKWGSPTYDYKGKKILAVNAFKNYVAIWFHQGVYLKDPHKVLIQSADGKAKFLRHWRFASANEIEPEVVLDYVLEAIQLEISRGEVK